MCNQRFCERFPDTPICVYLCSSVVPFFLTTDGHGWTRIFFHRNRSVCLVSLLVTTNGHELTRMILMVLFLSRSDWNIMKKINREE
ncbi:MAG: hypothetical protein CR997_10800 [Acidobacteria bacterium]|nr:MAG: hypothetical protein CR997_10800 [Acidobacteriota bacterium]